MALQQLPPPCSPAVGSRPRCNQGIIPDESKRELSKRTNPGGKFPKYIQERLCHTDTAFLIPFHNLAASTTKTPCRAATAMPHNPTASPSHRHRNASPPHRHRNASQPHRLTASPPHRLTATAMPHNLTASPPPQCLTVSPTHRLTASPPHCRVAP